MQVKTKVLIETKYKTTNYYYDALHRWSQKGWNITYQDYEWINDTAISYAILHKIIKDEKTTN